MDYTQSPEHVTHVATGNRMHAQNQAVPTEVTDKDLNSVHWSLMELVKAAGLAGQQFDPGAPASYQVLRNAMAELLRRGYGAMGVAGGTADAITVALTPPPVALIDGMAVRVRAASANATTTPTLAVAGLVPKTIVKGNGRPLAAGDIDGAGHWLDLQFDSIRDAWVLANPTSGVDQVGRPGRVYASNDWTPIGGGLILQWGNTSGGLDIPSAGVSLNITFPIAFPTAAFQVVGTLLSTGLSGANSITASVVTPTGCVFYLEEWAALGQAAGVRYFAIGR